MLSGISDFLNNIFSFIQTIFDFVATFVKDLIYFIGILIETPALISSFFSWLPQVVMVFLLSMLALVIILRIADRL